MLLQKFAKPFVFLAVFLLAVAGSGCSVFEEESRDAFFRADRDGELFSGEASAELTASDELLLRGARGNEHVLIQVPFAGEGTYGLGARAASHSVFIGDVIESTAYSFGAAEDRLTITGYDPDSRVVEGTFAFRLRDTVTEEVVSYTEGRFQAAIRVRASNDM